MSIVPALPDRTAPITRWTHREPASAANASLTAKIKSKMALDDHVSASSIGVTTKDGRVTLTGTVGSDDERRRAVDLARDTKGVSGVDDRIVVRRN